MVQSNFDSEAILEGVKSNDKHNTWYNKKYQDYIPCSSAHKVVCLDDKFSKPVVLYRGKNAVNKFIEAILKKYDYCKKKKKDEKVFQQKSYHVCRRWIKVSIK